MPARKSRPVGQPTRGKTALNRLRQIDTYILLAWAHSLSTSLVVDVGYGAYPWTALEMLDRWRAVNPRLRLLGVEIDSERVAAALPYVEGGSINFRQGGFNVLDVLGQERVGVIRALNVLRQYDEAAVDGALGQMGAGLTPGGLLIEGTSTPSGRLVAFDVYQKNEEGLQHRELVFGTNFREPPSVTHFQAILPKRLIHHAQEAPAEAFFAAWRRALMLARGHGGMRRGWVEAGRFLAERFGYSVDTRPRILSRGYLVLREMLTPEN
jgi:hypothetical protein